MAVQAQKTRLLVGDFHLAAHSSQVSAPFTVDTHDVTVFTDGGDRSFIAGRQSSTFAVSGFYSTAAHADLADWQSDGATPLTYGISGFSVGSEAWLVNGIETSFNTVAAGDDASKFDLTAQTDGATNLLGVVLHDLGAETADGSSSSVDGGAASSGGAVAHLHVTAYSGFTDVNIIVEDSANNSDWATIGTFTEITAATSQRLEIAGTVRRYTRVTVDVDGTGSVTYAAALARN